MYFNKKYEYEILLNYGFKKCSYSNCYELRTESYILIIYCYNYDSYKRDKLYLEVLRNEMILEDFKSIYKLIKDGVLIDYENKIKKI